MIIIPWLIVVASSVVTFHGVHRWLFFNRPQIGAALPQDTGAWFGIIVGVIHANHLVPLW